MNVKDYISSGILEEYVAGSVTEQELKEVQCLSAIYPEIKTALDELHLSMEAYVDSHKAPVRPELKKLILSKIDLMDEDELPSMNDAISESEVSTRKENVVSLPKTSQNSSMIWKIAAGLLLLLGAFQFFYFNSNTEDLKGQLALLEEKNTEIQNSIEEKEQLASIQEEYLAVLGDPNTTKVNLNPVSDNKDQKATVYWHSGKKIVLINKDALPDIATNQSYQLWALKGNTPIDLGVIDMSSAEVQKMTNVNSADAFAITIEPSGGSPSPTMDQLQVMGKI